LQIWIYPERADLEPSYEQRNFSTLRKPNHLTLLASQCGKKNSLTVHQNMELHGAILETGKQLEYELAFDRHAWIQVVKGAMIVNGIDLEKGDGCGIDEETLLTLVATDTCEFLLFDLA
jgi:redox-sensitive bicupin YhaK (pirin superfamily)